MRKIIISLMFVGLTLTSSIVSATMILAVTSFSGGNESISSGTDLPRLVGWNLFVNSDMSVSSLGFWDQGLIGLSAAHQIGLWDSNGTLLSDVIVQAGTSSTLIDGWRYETIAAIMLNAGSSYTIGSTISLNDDTYIWSPSTVSATGDITFGNGVRGSENISFEFPTLESNSGRFVPNFIYSTIEVSEPSLLGLLSLGLVLLIQRRRAD